MSTLSAPGPPLPAPEPAAVESAPNLAPPAGNPRFPLFDSLRAIAALSVFLGHTVTETVTFTSHPTLFLYAVQLANQGVAVFFLISGFLLYRPFLVARRGGPPLSVPGFARRRVLRIVPAYWAALTIFLLLGYVSGVNGHNWPLFYGFGQIYNATDIGRGIGVAWTLCIEVTFYVALPIFSLLAARFSRRPAAVRADLVLLVVLSIGSLIFRAHFNGFTDVAKVSTLAGTFTWFAFGMALAIASVTIGSRPRAALALARAAEHPLLCWAAAVVAFVASHELEIHTTGTATVLAEHVIYAFVALLVLLPGVFGEERTDPVRRLLRTSSLVWIGLVSYAFYLYHTIVIQELDKQVTHDSALARWALALVGGFAITAACSALSYYLLERPCMRWGRRQRPSARRSSSLDTAD